MNAMNTRQSPTPVSPLELRAIAGAAPSRRGSALLIVIGTLALVAVFAAVYVSIGRTDRRAAAAHRSRLEQQGTSTNFAEYLSGVVAIDRLEKQVQYDASGVPFARREVTDAPYTDWTRRSESNSISGHDYFTPSGAPLTFGSLSADQDFRVASDPWLASTLPTFLGGVGFDPVSLNERPFSSGYDPAINPNYPNAKNFLDNRDWLQISNFAPDGRFVNLFNLRPNSAFNDNTIGAFDAEPGFGATNVNGRNVRRMSQYLSLLRMDEPTDPESALTVFDPAADGVWLPGSNTPTVLSGPNAPTASQLRNTPAVWTMNQRFMYMPINQPFLTLNRQGQVSGWADPDYPAYQYADADGDGFADSRWFELVAARDSGEGADSQPREDVQWLYDKRDTRYFVAARAVDLSSMVNVNTATDQLVPPTLEHPFGATPADVDLRRLLTMQDAAENYSAHNDSFPLSYGELHRPYVADNEPQRGPWRPENASGWEDRNLRRNVADYWNYKHYWSVAGGGVASEQDLRKLDMDSTAMLIGRYAYDALRRGITLGNTLGADFKGYNIEFGEIPTLGTDLLQYEIDPTDTSPVPGKITAEKRAQQYAGVGSLDPANIGLAAARAADFGQGLYGIDDLAELLTYHGLNDPEVTSRLERVTSGRYESPFEDVRLRTERYGPLMSNRPLSLDRYQHGLVMTNINQNPNTAPSYDFPNLREVNGRVAFNSMAMMALTPRNKLTTISGFNPISPDEVFDDLAPTALTQASELPSLGAAYSDAGLLFGLYFNALAGELDLDTDNNDWPTAPMDFGDAPTSTLFYGHRGAELALRIAAHAAVNMKDIADGDGDPTVATLIVDNDQRGVLENENNFDDPEGDDSYDFFPGVADGNLFDPDRNLVDPGATNLLNNNLPDQRQVVNVYGVEAMPVITEVSVLYAYTDASEMAGGDDDSDGPQPRPFGGGVLLPTTGSAVNITINGVQSTDNEDYLGQVLAVQLHNPYGKSISLGGDGLTTGEPLTRQREFDDQNQIDTDSNYQFDYYIEFAGRFYKLAQYIQWYPTDQNAENYFDIDDPLTTQAYGTVDNPSTVLPRMVGGQMDPGTASPSANPDDLSGSATYSDFITRNVVLGPGETRVFYVLAEKRFDTIASTGLAGLDDRWETQLTAWGELPRRFSETIHDADGDGTPDGFDGRGWTGPAQEWFSHHLKVRGNGNQAVMMMEFDPRNGKLLNEQQVGNAIVDPTVAATSPLFSDPSRNDDQQVRLWKKVVTRGEEMDEQDNTNTDIPNPTYRNLVENDLLVDRMDLTGTLTLTLNTGADDDVEISGTVSYNEGVSVINGRRIRNDNTGISVVQWKTQRRGDSDIVGDWTPEPGEVTPWLLRSFDNPALTEVSHDMDLPSGMDLTGADILDDDSGDTTLTETPIKNHYEIHQTLREMFDVSIAAGGREIVQTLALPPHRKKDAAADIWASFTEDDGANDTAGKFGASPISVTNTALEGRNVQLFAGGLGTVNNTPRLADLLLAWGVGPSYAPDPTRSTNNGIHVEEEWMTMSEAMAAALGFEALASAPDTQARSVWMDAWNTTEKEGVLDSGRLSLDRFVPFVNFNPSEDPAEFTLGTDTLRGSGVPMAMGVIDRARALAPISRIDDPSSPTGGELVELAMARPTFGTININTAPPEVLRLLPGLSPSRGSYIDGTTFGQQKPEWWGREFTGTNLPLLNTPGLMGGIDDDLAENLDVAAGIVAYRDRVYTSPTTGAHPDVFASAAHLYNEGPMNLTVNSALNGDALATNMRTEASVWDFASPTMIPSGNEPMDRVAFTGIPGLRQTPGFGSLGELLALRVNPEFDGLDLARWNNLRPMTIQQLGYDGKAQGIDSAGPDGAVTMLSQIYSGDTAGDVVDGYDERLALANAVFNTVSVRSDFFAVWFVVQGYRESDVANLRPEDPLVPSVQKRYLMVLDRSNVIEPGDKPKVLLLKELPL